MRVLAVITVLLASVLTMCPAPKPPADTVAVLVAARDLHPGVPITAEDVYPVQRDPQHLPAGVFLTLPDLVGQRPHERILAHEVIRAERLVSAERGLEVRVRRGHRAMVVPVVLPRGAEPAFVVLSTPDGETPPLYVLQHQQHDDGAYVTVSVTPAQAERLASLVGPVPARGVEGGAVDYFYDPLNDARPARPGLPQPIRPITDTLYDKNHHVDPRGWTSQP